MAYPKGPYKLVTVNTAPERAKRLIGRLIESIKDRYIIEHVENCESKMNTLSSSSEGDADKIRQKSTM